MVLTKEQLDWNNKINEKIKSEKEMKKDKEKLISEYTKLQIELKKVEESETLRKWKILSKAYKLGKEIYGPNFSIVTLSMHFEIPLTTTKRILSLDKANERTWKLINENKISVFKVTQILSTKNTDMQDELIDAVIKDNLSTYQIKKIKMYGKNVNKARLKIAMDKGFARKDVAYKSLKTTIERMETLLDLDKKEIPENKIPELIESLDILKIKIEEKLQELIER